MKRLAVALCALALVATTPDDAFAQPCGRPDVTAAFPDDGATGVPLDAILSAVYTETTEYLGEPVVFRGPDGERELAASFDVAEHRLFVTPEPLLPATEYRIVWPELRGLSTAAPGLGREVTFTTGGAIDRGPPEFEGLTGLDWDIRHVDDECTDELEARFRFDLRLGAASDDVVDALAVLVFQTRGPSIAAAPTLVALRPLPDDRRLAVDLAVGPTTGRVCFAAVARDLALAVSASGHVERCVETTAPPFFYGCALGGADGTRAAWLPLLAASALLLGRRARRGRA